MKFAATFSAVVVVAACSTTTEAEPPVTAGEPPQPAHAAAPSFRYEAEMSDKTILSGTAIRPAGPLNTPVPGLGPDWSEMTPETLVGDWVLHGSDGTVCTVTLAASGAAEWSSPDCKISLPALDTWQFAATNHLDFYNADGRHQWRLRRQGDQRFLGARPPLSRFILARAGDEVGEVAPFPDRRKPRQATKRDD